MKYERLVSIGLMVTACACGGGTTERAPAANEKVVEAPRSTRIDDTASSTVRRSAVKATLARGLGNLLADVALDEKPAFREGKFLGFRIVALKGPLLKSTLLPGDVVVSVNGMPIERPEQALAAFRGIAVASEIRVDFERKGEPMAARFAIVEDDADGGL